MANPPRAPPTMAPIGTPLLLDLSSPPPALVVGEGKGPSPLIVEFGFVIGAYGLTSPGPLQVLETVS